MDRWLKLAKLFLVSVVLSHFVLQPSANALSGFASPECEQALTILISHFQEASVRPLSDDPIYKWAVDDSSDPNLFYGFAVHRLESRVLSIIEENAPEFRAEAISQMAKDTGLTSEQIQSIIDYYAVVVFETPELAGKTEDVWNRLETLKRAIRMANPDAGSPESRYGAYHLLLTQESVPQIANRLGMSEAQVRSDLSILRLSIVDAFQQNGKLDRARAFIRETPERSLESIATELGVGSEALRFVLHYEAELNRGSPWNDTEVSTLLHGFNDGLPLREIAFRLNSLAGITPLDPLYRTEGAIAAKLDQLGLTIPRPRRFPTDVEIEGYGNVKRNGHLTEAAKAFVRDHYLDPIALMAAQLQVSPEGLARFIVRHDLVVRDTPRSAPQDSRAPAPAAGTPELPKNTRVNSMDEQSGSPLTPNRARGREILASHEAQRKLKRSSEESLKNMIERIINVGGIPSTHSQRRANALSEAQKQDRAAYHYANNHRWTEAEVAALPDKVRPHIAAIMGRQQSGLKLIRSPEESLKNMIDRITTAGGIPHQNTQLTAADLTPDQEKDRAATQYARYHRWTEEEISALPEPVRPHIDAIFRRQQNGKKLRRTPAESLQNLIARVEKAGGIPSEHSGIKIAEMSEEQKDDRAANHYSRRVWTETEVKALPSSVRQYIEPIFQRQQNGQRLKRTAEESLKNMIDRIEKRGGIPSRHSDTRKSDLSDAQEQDRAANSYARDHRWTEDEIAALPESVRPHLQRIFEKQKRSKESNE